MKYDRDVAAERKLLAALTFTLLLALIGCADEADRRQTPPPAYLSPEARYYVQKAHSAFEAGAYFPALMLADSAEALAPRSAVVPYLRGRILTEVERYNEAELAYENALKLQPDYTPAQLNLANNHFRQERYREALNTYRQLLEVITESPSEHVLYAGDTEGRQARHNVLLQIGRTYKSLGAADSAKVFYDRALQINPNSAAVYKAVSELHESQGNLEEALTFARRAAEIDPNDVEVRYLIGSLLQRMGRNEEAVGHLEWVLDHDSTYQSAFYNLGRALTVMGRTEEAEEYLAESERLRDLDARLDDLAETAQINARNPNVWIEYADALRQAGRLEKAKKAYERSLALTPWNLALQNNLAILAEQLGDTEEAIARYRAVLSQDSTLADVWYNLGVVYANSGEERQAARAWEETLRQDPDHTSARQFLAKIRNQ